MTIYNPSESSDVEIAITEEAIDTALTIDISDVNGQPITKAKVGDIVYISGVLTATINGVPTPLPNMSVVLYRNNLETRLRDTTHNNGSYIIHYTVVVSDVPSAHLKTKFEGA